MTLPFVTKPAQPIPDNEFRIVVAGGREFTNYVLLANALDKLLCKKKLTHKIVFVSGKARGADSLGERYAKERAYRIIEKPADWDRYGKSAGYKRNKEMAEISHCTVAFWDGKSKGTKHMIDLTKQLGNDIGVVRYDTVL